MRLQDNGTSIAVWISANDTREWANRPSDMWPCSTLAGKRLFAAFDSNGLYDVRVDGDWDDYPDEVDGHEFNAIVCDMLRDRLSPEHPCYYVCVGQFV